jgi:demethoxyubiquinone hydroxylase (CLK1/Coq7/Cat5 family)
MKPSFRYILVFIVGVLVGLAAGAWGLRAAWRHTPPSPEGILSHLDKKLNLTEDQKTKALVILTEESAKMKSLRQEVSGEFETLRNSGADRLRDILDSKQQMRFDEMKKKFDQHRMDPFAPPGPAPSGAPTK